MYTIKSNVTNTLTIKNSKFITYLIKVNDNSNIIKILSSLKKTYPKANHYVYVYKTPTSKKTSDDNEPAKTAALPILNILEKNNLTNIFCVVIRYFGGIKLGTGGLVRAYSQSLQECLKKATIVTLKASYQVQINISYSQNKDFMHLIKENCQVISKTYLGNISYIITIPKDKLMILDNYNYKILANDFLEINKKD